MARSKSHPAWRRMILRHRHHPGIFHETCGFRANLEGAMPSIKRHQGPFIRTRGAVEQRRAARRMIARKVHRVVRSRLALGSR